MERQGAVIGIHQSQIEIVHHSLDSISENLSGICSQLQKLHLARSSTPQGPASSPTPAAKELCLHAPATQENLGPAALSSHIVELQPSTFPFDHGCLHHHPAPILPCFPRRCKECLTSLRMGERQQV